MVNERDEKKCFKLDDKVDCPPNTTLVKDEMSAQLVPMLKNSFLLFCLMYPNEASMFVHGKFLRLVWNLPGTAQREEPCSAQITEHHPDLPSKG
jgi:hypothetical protein